ncbi:Trimethylguanosine synthase [Thelohanellus kitauei]|uniref:Trimethylguanosine synthase n=1 Tax=Thelohanellus kitauei TaxID=669202 RepID=A0A0C2NB93_THEKT|nr:Trimethylguanosine synthase [Thelohanellus kitauei]
MKHVRADGVFLSPPWGGPSYIGKKVYSLENDLKPSINDLFSSMNMFCQSIALFLPRNSDMRSIKRFSKKYFDGKYESEKNYVENELKAITIYLGNATQK